MRIGINPLTWTNDDLPSLGDGHTLEQCLTEARLAGYAGVELGRKFPRTAAALGPLLASHHLSLVSGWYSARLLERPVEDEILAMAPHRDLLVALGAKVMVFCETSGAVHGDRSVPLSQRPRMQTDDWARLLPALNVIAAHLRSHGLALAYHHHMGTRIQSGDDIDRLLAGTSSDVGLLLDTGHLTFAGADPLAVARRHTGRIVHVHCKDVRRTQLQAALDDDASFLDAVMADVFAVPGDGVIDFAPVLASLLDAGYDGWLVVEADQDPDRAHPLTHARLGYRTLSDLLARQKGQP